jgi:hypothetical protein
MPPVLRTVKASMLVIATAGAGPWRMRGVCWVIATARNGSVRPASQVSQVAR